MCRAPVIINVDRSVCRWCCFHHEQELAAPYYEFKKAGFDIDIASIAGGKAPLDEMSKQEEYQTEDTRRFLEDASAMANVDATRPISEFVANASTYGAVFLPGGHGTAVDFADKYGYVATSCHRGFALACLPLLLSLLSCLVLPCFFNCFSPVVFGVLTQCGFESGVGSCVRKRWCCVRGVPWPVWLGCRT